IRGTYILPPINRNRDLDPSRKLSTMKTQTRAKTILFALVLALMAIPAANYAAQFMGGSIIPSVHAQGTNDVGFNCAYGSFVSGAPVQSRDGDGTLNPSCQWAGDIDGDGTFDPLVADPASGLPPVTCSLAPCAGAPGGGGFEVSVIVFNLNDSVNGFDLTVSYNPHVLNAVLIDQQGLTFGGNAGCSSCTLQLASTIDNVNGQVRLAQTLLGVTAGTIGGNIELFRIRFDVVGAGSSSLAIGGVDKITHSVNNTAQPLPHTDEPGSFSTDAIYDLLNGTTGLGYSVSWTFAPSPEIPFQPLSFTATATCAGCTAPLSYAWDFSSVDSATYTPKVNATGATATVTVPPQVVNRVTLTVTDAAAHMAFATRVLPLTTGFTGPGSAVLGTATGPYKGGWLGGVVESANYV